MSTNKNKKGKDGKPPLKRYPTAKMGLMKRMFSFKKTQTSNSTFEIPATLKESELETTPNLIVGHATDLGFNHEYNEDTATMFPDLLAMFPGDEAEYQGVTNRTCSFFGVFDGHGGGTASKYARDHVHEYFANLLWRGNYGDMVGSALHHAFRETESKFWDIAKAKNDTSGSCATTVVIRGDKIFCGNAGDSKALLFTRHKSNKSKAGEVYELNERHSTELKSERQRIKAAGGKISADGAVYGVLFPTRGFGDIDVKADGKPVVIATPTGVGIEPEDPITLDRSAISYLILASDGLWDFVSDNDIIAEALKQPQQSETEIAQSLIKAARMGGSEDDVTIVVVQITFDD